MADAPGRPYRPKDFALIPANFGRDRGIQWRTPPSEAKALIHNARVVAARIQHGLIYALAHHNAQRHATDADAAALVGINPDRMGRLRRGDLPMRTEELGLFCVACDIPIQQVIAYAGLQPRDWSVPVFVDWALGCDFLECSRA